ncbi:TIGR02391 family protein [Acidobacteria bacterium AH-259-L09]|nr:TIGR02391 family protein [Acidobacteria bacterium AH-259-L09]
MELQWNTVMSVIPKLNDTHLEAICNIIGDTSGGLTGSEITRLLQRCGIEDPLPSYTKRHRLFEALQARQNQDSRANNVLAFLQVVMEPARYVSNRETFERLRGELNVALAFCGFTVGEDGKVGRVEKAATLAQAQQRAGRLRSKLTERNVHHDVLPFCRAELLQENYFHAVFEATKSVAEKIRDKTGLTGDGAELVDQAFKVSNPLLAINTLRTETEQSEQKGFANLLKGMFGTFRNVTAHAPKITWRIEEQDALDLLTLVSYLHRRLDAAAVVRRSP